MPEAGRKVSNDLGKQMSNDQGKQKHCGVLRVFFVLFVYFVFYFIIAEETAQKEK